jgi:hypothetical protein
MTYKEIINRFRTVTENHKQLKDFGYGELSDLKTQSQLGPEDEGVDYPYLFLLPAPSVRQGPVMEYSFNMVVMDMARGEEGDQYDNYITIQSQCQQYIDDVLANLYYYYKDQPEIQLTGITYTPFKEKYQDELAGMTATITIQVPTPLNECIAPFAQEIVRARNLTDNENDGGRYLYAATFDPEGVWTDASNILTTQQAGEYEFTIDQIITLNQPLAGETIPTTPILRRTIDFVLTDFEPIEASGWPTEFVDETTQYRYKATYRGTVPLEDIQSFSVFAIRGDDDPLASTIQQLAGGTLNIKRL